MTNPEPPDFKRTFLARRGELTTWLIENGQSADDAADITAEAFLRLWAHRHRFPPEEDRWPWLFSIAHRLMLKTRRLTRVQHATAERLADFERRHSAPPVL
jgi:DNA-directed RNA polymerase specialized sigma24 family protein